MPQPAAPAPSAPSKKTRAAEARRAALIEHTRALMLEHGPHNVSLAEVLRLAGGSKATVVKYFTDRNGLIAAAVHATAVAAMQELTPPDDGTPLEQALPRLLSGILRFYLQPASLTVYRGVIAGSGGNSGVAEAFYASGHAHVIDSLSTFLDRWKGRGIRPDLPAHEAAEQLAHALRSGLYETVLLGIATLPVDDQAIIDKADAVAGLFLAGALT